MNVMLTFLLIAVTVNIVMFIPAYKYRTDKLTDVSYALTFILVTSVAFGSGVMRWQHFLLMLMIFWWAVRLGGFLLYRVSKKGKDARFDEMRNSLLSFLRFWVLQGVSVFLILIPAVLYMRTSRPNFNGVAAAGLCLFMLGLYIEARSDLEKWQFSQKSKNKGLWIASGMWSRSRHPNYFGEMLVWIGIYTYVLPSLTTGQRAWGLISPLYIIILLRFVSGVPLLEKSADNKWGSNTRYENYKKNTPLLIPKIK